MLRNKLEGKRNQNLEAGVYHTGERFCDFGSTVERYFEGGTTPLYAERLIGGAKTKSASDFYSNSMRLQFDEFLWCESDWKVEAFATILYRDCTSHRNM